MGLASKIGGGQPGAPPAGAPPPQQTGNYAALATSSYPQVGAAAPGGGYGAPPQGQSAYGQPQYGQLQPGFPQQPYGAPPRQPSVSPYTAPQQQPHAGSQANAAQQPGAAHFSASRQGAAQQPQYGQPQHAHSTVTDAACAPGAAGFDVPTIRQKLAQLVSENRLHAFYPPQRLEEVARFVAGRDVAGLGARWGLPREITLDLCSLALYDIAIFVDDSGSMLFEEGGERIDDMRVVLGRTADAATLFDDDGIVVRFMNSTLEGNGIHSEAEAAALVQQVKFSGLTPLGTSLDAKVLQPLVLGQARAGSMSKPVLVIAITDGSPAGEPRDTVRQVILNAKRVLGGTPYGAGAVAFQFAQVGKDAGATRFLSLLDVDPVVGGMIDCTSYFEQEQEEYARKGVDLTPAVYLTKLMLGGIDSSYDEADE